MPEKIRKISFREGKNQQIDIVPLSELLASHSKHIIQPHRTNFYHIFLLYNCQPTHIVDFTPINTQPFSLLFIDKNRVHQFDRLLNYDGEVIVFTDDFFNLQASDSQFLRNSTLFNDIANNYLLRLQKADFEKISRISSDIKAELETETDSATHIFMKNMLHNLLLLALRAKNKSSATQEKKGADLEIAYMLYDLIDRNFIQSKSVADYAAQLCMSEKRLGMATAKSLDKSPKEMINDRILLEAKRLLVYTHSSVKEIGHTLGFEDPAYFVRYFKKNCRQTPAEFRNANT